MDAVDAFAQVVQREPLRLDAATGYIAAALRPPVDVDAIFKELDRLAESCADATVEAVRAAIYDAAGFRGNVANYVDPENSMLDAVLRRRVGIPITLAVVFMEVARRVGLTLEPVSMPGHFLVRVAQTGQVHDPFDRGAALDPAGIRALHERVFGGRRQLQEHELQSVEPVVVVARVLNNLEQSSMATRPASLQTMLELHAMIPGLPPGEHLALAARFNGIGRHRDAALAAERAARELHGEELLVAQRTAAQCWARTN